MEDIKYLNMDYLDEYFSKKDRKRGYPLVLNKYCSPCRKVTEYEFVNIQENSLYGLVPQYNCKLCNTTYGARSLAEKVEGFQNE